MRDDAAGPERFSPSTTSTRCVPPSSSSGMLAASHADAIVRRPGHASAVVLRIGDRDLITRRPDRPREGKARPPRWYAGVDPEGAAMSLQAKDALESCAVHPPGRSGVPGPPPPPIVRRMRVHIARRDVRLRLVTVDIGGRPRVVDRVQHVEELHRLVAIAEPGHRHDCPDRGMRVLPAVLAHARRITLDVAGILGRLVERRRQEQHGPRRPPYQVRAHRVHRALGAGKGCRAGEHGPGLRDRVDLALVVLRGAERRSVVIVGPAVPVAVPGEFQHRRETRGLTLEARRARPVARRQAERRDLLQHGEQEPPEPHALAAARGVPPGSSRHSSLRCRSGAGHGRPR